MEEANIIHRMLKKGEKNMINYENFDYSKLDNEQIKYIRHLSFFSKYKNMIIQYFGMNKTSIEGKIAFLEVNSMKMGAVLFNRLEQSRLEVNHGYYIFPYFSGGIAFGCFLLFAWFTPMHSKLYREIGYSCLFGGLCGASYIYYHKLKYYKTVDDCYGIMRKFFDKNPQFETLKEDRGIIKNFGFNRYSFMEEDEITGEWEEELAAEPSIFEGNINDESEFNKERLIQRIDPTR